MERLNMCAPFVYIGLFDDDIGVGRATRAQERDLRIGNRNLDGEHLRIVFLFRLERDLHERLPRRHLPAGLPVNPLHDAPIPSL